ncbi:unnamed protein product [Pedinophyceae sp. YPF-701]|nr:unnamed protein product [Pedinophyceae sp. YPF-701]
MGMRVFCHVASRGAIAPPACPRGRIAARNASLGTRRVAEARPDARARASKRNREPITEADVTPEMRAIMERNSQKWEGLPLEEKVRRCRISLANRGKKPWNQGGHHSEETKNKIRDGVLSAMKRPEVAVKLKNAAPARKRTETTKVKPAQTRRSRSPRPRSEASAPKAPRTQGTDQAPGSAPARGSSIIRPKKAPARQPADEGTPLRAQEPAPSDAAAPALQRTVAAPSSADDDAAKRREKPRKTRPSPVSSGKTMSDRAVDAMREAKLEAQRRKRREAVEADRRAVDEETARRTRQEQALVAALEKIRRAEAAVAALEQRALQLEATDDLDGADATWGAVALARTRLQAAKKAIGLEDEAGSSKEEAGGVWGVDAGARGGSEAEEEEEREEVVVYMDGEVAEEEGARAVASNGHAVAAPLQGSLAKGGVSPSMRRRSSPR